MSNRSLRTDRPCCSTVEPLADRDKVPLMRLDSQLIVREGAFKLEFEAFKRCKDQHTQHRAPRRGHSGKEKESGS